uniref:Uncharacterized protein AlNc14C103G6110 n=1 Tax=Albugo laibachii Nc14 TaxID=890382 RepID=F0WHQ3_9STRA|nr:hypothetical protein BRAFLDRAFT_247293 [Albugo laibachii Nc14]CCA23716.1 hypothetical protein BRAFLDRAFT_247293 [Albugo laibachii Nc14]|eukprot:CCA23716.1 hypothetical protein BRAFLDRAFT_247293 [Albugo laibachii Nc14]
MRYSLITIPKEILSRFPQHFTYTRFDLTDLPSTDLKECIAFSIAFINRCVQADEKVLVHCSAGKSRSIAIVTAYLMHSRGIPFHKAYECIRSVRPQAQMNSGFRTQLREWNFDH